MICGDDNQLISYFCKSSILTTELSRDKINDKKCGCDKICKSLYLLLKITLKSIAFLILSR